MKKIVELSVCLLVVLSASCSSTRPKKPNLPRGRVGKVNWDYNYVIFRPREDQKIHVGQRLDIYYKGECEGYVEVTKYLPKWDVWVADLWVRTYNYFEEGSELRIRKSEQER